MIASTRGEADFRDEIHGREFALTVPDLMAGEYTVEIGLAELDCDHAGQRVFDIVCGDQVIATNLDIFAVAGGKDKVIRIRAKLEHAGDAVNGPLSIRFIGRSGDAKLNTFEIWDAAGASLVSMKVADLIMGDDAATWFTRWLLGRCQARPGPAGGCARERPGQPHVTGRKSHANAQHRPGDSADRAASL